MLGSPPRLRPTKPIRSQIFFGPCHGLWARKQIMDYFYFFKLIIGPGAGAQEKILVILILLFLILLKYLGSHQKKIKILFPSSLHPHISRSLYFSEDRRGIKLSLSCFCLVLFPQLILIDDSNVKIINKSWKMFLCILIVYYLWNLKKRGDIQNKYLPFRLS